MSTNCSDLAPKGVTAVEKSENKKLGDCSVTLASQHTCPGTCPFRENGCYAEQGPIGWATARLNRSTETSRVALARQEAAAIAGLSGKRPLRLHVVGDSTTVTGTMALARAAMGHRVKHGQPVWTYTHAWRTVARPYWGPVSVLASCESRDDVAAANGRGYAAALVVDTFESDKAHAIGDGYKLIPCPNQTRGRTCDTCRLCMDADRLHENKLVIGFAAHGSGAKRVRHALTVL